MVDQTRCTVEAKWDELLAERDRLMRQVESLDRDIAILNQALAIAGRPTTYRATPEGGAVIPEPVPSAPAHVEMVGHRPRTHLDVVTEMALANEGVVHLTTAAKQIMADGLSEATIPAHITATLHARLIKDPRWEKVGRGTFKLIDRPVVETTETGAPVYEGPPAPPEAESA